MVAKDHVDEGAHVASAARLEHLVSTEQRELRVRVEVLEIVATRDPQDHRETVENPDQWEHRVLQENQVFPATLDLGVKWDRKERLDRLGRRECRDQGANQEKGDQMEKTGHKDLPDSPGNREKSESKENRDHRGPLVKRANPVRTVRQERLPALVGKAPWDLQVHLGQKVAKDRLVFLVQRDHKDNGDHRANRDHQAQWEDPVLLEMLVHREKRDPGVKKDIAVRLDPTANQELRANPVLLVRPETGEQRERRDHVGLLGRPEKVATADQRALPEQQDHRDPLASLDHRVVLVMLAQLA